MHVCARVHVFMTVKFPTEEGRQYRNCKLPEAGVRNWTQVLSKTGRYFKLLNHLSDLQSRHFNCGERRLCSHFWVLLEKENWVLSVARITPSGLQGWELSWGLYGNDRPSSSSWIWVMEGWEVRFIIHSTSRNLDTWVHQLDKNRECRFSALDFIRLFRF